MRRANSGLVANSVPYRHSCRIANCQPIFRSQPLSKPRKYSKLRSRGSERAKKPGLRP